MFQFEIDDPSAEVPDGGDSHNNVTSVGFEIGNRISSDKDFGVVKYIGAVGTHPGIWLGIEWDNPARGKHNGTVDNVEYFKCSVPNAASFVRLAKAKKLKDVVKALHERYGDDGSVSTMKSIEDRLETRKISFSKLKVLNLSSRGINDLSAWKEFSDLCPNIEVLEISTNLISDWNSVGNLCRALTNLIRLDLSRNPLPEPSTDEIESQKQAFPKLQHVILGYLEYTLEGILRASEMFPQIVKLTAPYNIISTISSPINTLSNLTSIDLEKNNITNWLEVLNLTVLERLEHINLCGNRITKIRFPEGDCTTDGTNALSSYFPNLVRLNITENLIEDWPSVSELGKLKKLNELRIDMNPFQNEYKRTMNRQIIIARLGRLAKLEGVEIHRQERRDAELDYVKHFSQEWSNVSNRENFNLEHPLYAQLATKYGLFEVSDKKSRAPAHSMQSSLINLIIVPESSLSYKECEKKILKTMTVQKLKGLLQRMFRIPAVPIQITVTSCQNPAINFVLENDFIEIGQYSIEDGDTLRLRW